MKTLHDLTQLVTELDRRTQAKNDFVISTTKIGFEQVGEDDNKKIALNIPGHGYFDIDDHTHNQIASRIGVPVKYYKRMLHDAPELLMDNVQHWFTNSPEQRMIRTLDQKARAFLSDRYKRIDNELIAQAALPAITENEHAVVLSSGITDKKLYIKALFPNLEAEVLKGDIVRPGVIISNSEIGSGSFQVQSFFYRDFCTNGCVFGREDAFTMKRTHLGGRLIEGVAHQIFTDESLEADDKAMMLQIRDAIGAASDEDLFHSMVDKLRESTEGEKIINPEDSIELLSKTYGLNENERGQALINLIEDKDYSKWGALNAITKVANEAESYDRASELESIGGKILELQMRDWNRIAVAA